MCYTLEGKNNHQSEHFQTETCGLIEDIASNFRIQTSGVNSEHVIFGGVDITGKVKYSGLF